MSWRSRTFETLPALSVRGSELRRSLRLVVIGWMYGIVWQTFCTTGDQVRAFGAMLGFNDFAFGLLGALPYLALLGQFSAAEIVDRTGLRKVLFMDSQFVGRLLWCVVALVPFAIPLGAGGSPVAVWLVLAILAVSYFLAGFSTPPWMTWMGDLIPRRIRGRYFGRRSQITQAVSIVAIIVISVALEWCSDPAMSGREDASRQPHLLWLLCGILGVGGIFGFLDIWQFRSIREIFPPRKPEEDHRPAGAPRGSGFWLGGTLRSLVEPMRDRVFRHFSLYGAVMTFTASFPFWFFWRYASERMGFSPMATNGLFLLISPLACSLTGVWWGRMIDRWGRRPVLILSSVVAAVAVLPWLFMHPGMASPPALARGVNWLCSHVGGWFGRGDWNPADSQTPLLAYLMAVGGCILGGSGWTGIGLGQNSIVLDFCDTKGSRAVAASQFYTNMGGVLGGLAGGIVTQSLASLQDRPLAVGPFLWDAYQFTFLGAMVLRLLSVYWLLDMPDPGARPFRHMMRHLTQGIVDLATYARRGGRDR